MYINKLYKCYYIYVYIYVYILYIYMYIYIYILYIYNKKMYCLSQAWATPF